MEPAAEAIQEPGSHAAGSRLARHYRRSFNNMLAGLMFSSLLAWGKFGQTARERLRPSLAHLIRLLLLHVLLGLSFDLAYVGLNGTVNIAALPTTIFFAPLLLLTAWLAARLAARIGTGEPQTPGLFLTLAVAFAAIALPAEVALNIIVWLPDNTWSRLGTLQTWVISLPVIWQLLAMVSAVWAICDTPVRLRLRACCVVLLLGLAPLSIDTSSARLWVDRDSEGSTPQPAIRSAASEGALYGQNDLLERALDAVQPGRRSDPELFLLNFAGTGHQDVFMREVDAVEHLFDQRFDTTGHVITLVNNQGTAETRPMATVTALQHALQAMAQKMNPDKDVLVLFLTSHGSPQHVFSVRLYPYDFEQITPAALREMLDDAGIRYRVIVVSACYSGGFIEPLATPETLVMTASRADRNSFGCSSEADWTYFGHAYFGNALTHTHSFEQAFAQARELIAKRELAEQQSPPSEPQISVGNAIRPKLAEIAARLDREQTVAKNRHNTSP